jgi:hypothetical protein
MATRIKKEVPDPQEVLALHERQSWAASMINLHFGEFKDSKPELWTHRTFMLIVAKLYEHLVLCEKISAKEFVALTKTLAQSGKSRPVGRGGEETESTTDSNLGGVVAGLEDMVRQIYGTNLQSADPSALPSSTPITPGLAVGT